MLDRHKCSVFFSGDINLSLNISSSFVSELFFDQVFGTFVVLSAILFPIKSPVTSVVFDRFS